MNCNSIGSDKTPAFSGASANKHPTNGNTRGKEVDNGKGSGKQEKNDDESVAGCDSGIENRNPNVGEFEFHLQPDERFSVAASE